jgi:hypothetical protein
VLGEFKTAYPGPNKVVLFTKFVPNIFQVRIKRSTGGRIEKRTPSTFLFGKVALVPHVPLRSLVFTLVTSPGPPDARQCGVRGPQVPARAQG